MNKRDGLFHGASEEQNNHYQQIQNVDFDAQRDPKYYKASSGLAAAVNVALRLGMPLLLTGEPGGGKSQLASRIQWEMGFPEEVLKFSVKSTTEAKDLFYNFDTVGRFHAAYTDSAVKTDNTNSQAVNFITYQALGLALLKSKGKQGVDPSLMKPSDYQKLADNPVRSVVLIDEIDKAPREVPNDILNEIETMAFTIPELESKEVKLNTQGTENAPPEPRPIVIITSNSERDLPEAFLRRCVFYHLPFPPFDGSEGEVTVRSIVQARFAKRFVDKSPLLEDILNLCEYVRKEEQRLSKLPSLAELLNWIDLLFKMNFESDKGLEQKGFDLIESLFLPVLLKTIDDQAIAKTLLQQWWTKSKGTK